MTINELHFLRPWWFLTLIPLLVLVVFLWRHTPKLQGWSDICDSHLLDHLMNKRGEKKQLFSATLLLLSFLFMIVALSGPAWHQLPVPTYKPVQPRVLILDMSEHMMSRDLTPNRLSRAKFKLHDLLARKEVGQFGLIVYTAEPFVVSPLTDDGQTISSLLSVLAPEIMPVSGQRLESALDEASKLMKQAGYNHGQILVLTADTPSSVAINRVKRLADTGIDTSILPVRADKNLNPLFSRFAHAGNGQLLVYSSDSSDLEQWMNTKTKERFQKNDKDEIPVWRDEGLWFLIPALLFFLPLFQRGWLQRIVS